MARKVIGTGWDRDNRNAMNDNFDDLYKQKAIAENAESTAYDAKSTALNAQGIAEDADAKAKSTQEQFNQVVIAGDSSVEAAQARVDETGNVHSTLKNRIDNGFGGVRQRIADVMQVNVKDYGIIANSTTDQTAQLIALFEGELKPFKGEILIPYGVRFSRKDVYPKIPLGAIVDDRSNVNYRSGGYITKTITKVAQDSKNYDTNYEFISGHHPFMVLNNLGTAFLADGVTPSESAKDRVSSYAHGFGLDANNNPLLNFVHKASKMHNADKWVYDLRMRRRFSAPGTEIDSGLMSIDEDGFVVFNGDFEAGVTFAIKKPKSSTSNSTMILLENNELSSNVSTAFRGRDASGTFRQRRIMFDAATNEFRFMNSANNATAFRIADNGDVTFTGTQLGVRKVNYSVVSSGTTPNVSSNSYFRMTHSTPTTITDFINGSDGQEITIFFQNANVTIANNANITLARKTDWNPTAESTLVLQKVNGYSNRWVEKHRTEI